MIVFLKAKKIELLLTIALWNNKNKYDLSLIRCAMKCYINCNNTLFVYWMVFSFQSGLKCILNVFYLILSKSLALCLIADRQ
jgi:hypothetical protein